MQAFYVVLVLGLGKGKGELDRLRFGSGVRFRFRIRTSWFAARTGRAGRGLEGVGGRPVGPAFGLRAADDPFLFRFILVPKTGSCFRTRGNCELHYFVLQLGVIRRKT